MSPARGGGRRKPTPRQQAGPSGGRARATSGRGKPTAAGGRRGAGPSAGRGGRGGADEPRRARPKADRGLGGEQVEGRQAVRELLIAGRRRVREVWVARDGEEGPGAADLAELAAGEGVAVREVSHKKLLAQARTEAPQGVLAMAAPLSEHDLDDLARVHGGGTPFLVALDGVTDPGNLGALLRSAECAGVTGVVLPRHRAVHVTPTVTKAAAGAIEYLPMALVGGLPSALARLRDAGVWVIGLDAGGPRALFDVPLGDEPVCLVLGAEGAGLSRLVRQRCDEVVAIPLLGHLGSLNVAAAGALACFEVARRRRG